jgi:hypothetical protein
VGRFAVGLALALACIALPAAAAPTLPRTASWADNRHMGGVSSVGARTGNRRRRSLCDRGRRAQLVADLHGRQPRLCARPHVDHGGRDRDRQYQRFQLLDAGQRRAWYELPNVPTPSSGDRALLFEGRGNLLFWHQSGTTLFQLTPWPAPADPPCKAQSWPGPGTCVLAAADSPFTSATVGSVSTGSLDRMRNVPGGVAVLVTATDPNASPAGVLVHRGDANAVTTLPEPPFERRSLTCSGFYAAWPTLLVEASAFSTGVGCARLPRVLWRSPDGGATWKVESTTHTGIRAAAAGRGVLGKRIALPGGTIAAYRAAPARLEIRQLATQRLRLPGGTRCRAAAVTVAWPALLVTGRRTSGVSAIRWWSNDGGSSWSIFGRC